MKVHVVVSNGKFPRAVFSSSEAAETYVSQHRWEHADWQVYEFAVDEDQRINKPADAHAEILAAAKEALAMIDDGHAEDAWMPLEPAIAKAEGRHDQS
jgi:hypothetical protein